MCARIAPRRHVSYTSLLEDIGWKSGGIATATINISQDNARFALINDLANDFRAPAASRL